MQAKLEQCGNLAVPVDESGTATGRPEAYQDKTIETKHTKGPWIFNETDACIWPGETAERRAPVCTMFTAADPVDCMSEESDIYSDEETANARLIACAPELLDVAELVVWMFSGETERSGHLDGLIKQAEAAIAKAKGNKT